MQMMSDHHGYVFTMTKSLNEISEDFSISEQDIKEMNTPRSTSSNRG